MSSTFSLFNLAFMGAFLSIASHGFPDRTTLVHFASKPAMITVKKASDTDETEELSLRDLVETRCKSLFTDFRPLWWLFKCVYATS